MYKSFKINKRVIISFERFRKSILKMNDCPKCYFTGFHKDTDQMNGLVFYTLTIYNYMVTLVVKNKYNAGHCASG